jgi:hypothetical protein
LKVSKTIEKFEFKIALEELTYFQLLNYY